MVETAIPDQLGCQWNAPAGPPYEASDYWLPPYWYAPPYGGGSDELSGPILRGYGAVGSTTLDPPASGGIRGIGFKADIPAISWNNGSQQLLGMYFANDLCFSGDLEYGFAHYYQSGTTQFYFYNYSNCGTGCFLVGATPPNPDGHSSPSVPVEQCSARASICPACRRMTTATIITATTLRPFTPTKPFYALPVRGSCRGSGASKATVWACMVDPLETPNFLTPSYPTSAPCQPQTEEYVNYSCTVNGKTGTVSDIQAVLHQERRRGSGRGESAQHGSDTRQGRNGHSGYRD